MRQGKGHPASHEVASSMFHTSIYARQPLLSIQFLKLLPAWQFNMPNSAAAAWAGCTCKAAGQPFPTPR